MLLLLLLLLHGLLFFPCHISCHHYCPGHLAIIAGVCSADQFLLKLSEILTLPVTLPRPLHLY